MRKKTYRRKNPSPPILAPTLAPHPDSKSLTLLEPDSLPNYSGIHGKLSDIIQYDHPGYQRMIASISQGAYPQVVAEAFGIPPTTFSRWMQRGHASLVAEQDTLYSRFYCDIRRAVAKCRTLVECKVRKIDPKHWLRLGPGKLLSQEWSDVSRKVDHSGRITHDIQGEINHSGTVTSVSIQGSELALVIKELAEAGLIDLNERSTQLLESLSPPEPDNVFDLSKIDPMEADVREAILD